MSTLNLWYWVRCDLFSQIFDIDVSPDTTLCDLCESLVNELRLQVPAVRLHKVPDNHPVLIDGDYKANFGKLCMSDLGPPLRLGNKVASIFTTAPREDRLHFVVDATTSQEIRCWIRGTLQQPVCIKLPNSEHLDVIIAKTRELEPQFRDVLKGDVDLYKISPSDEDELSEILDRRGEGELIPMHQRVADAFDSVPFSLGILEVVIEPFQKTGAPPSSRYLTGEGDTVQAKRQKFLNDCPSKAHSSAGAPSSFSRDQEIRDKAIPCGRPRDLMDPVPTTLLHPAFGQFVQDIKSIQPTQNDSQFARELVGAMSAQYKEGNSRLEKIHEVFAKHDIHLTRTKTSVFETDGDISINGHHYVMVEFRNEVGSGSAEPYFQNIGYYLESTRPRAAIMYHSPLPCLLLSIFGPFIAFACAAWNQRPTVELLAMPVAFHIPDYNIKSLQLLARYMAAFRRATETLKNYYNTLQQPTLQNAPASQLFPYPTTYTSFLTNTKKNIVYQRQEPNMPVFFGLERSADVDSEGSPAGDRICIKFTQKYSAEAHAYCASLGFAPTLRGFQQIPGDWFMVIMDDLSGKYESLFDRPVSKSTEPLLVEKLQQFHEAGFVHGDIRDTNIMVSVSDRTKFKLIDFDWAGKVADEPTYPLFVNTAIWRPTEAIDGEPILSAHDDEMLSQIYFANRWCG